MMKRSRGVLNLLLWPLVSVLALSWGACSPAIERQDPLLVFAAASLADVMAEVGLECERSTGLPVRFSFAGSNTLARQIEAGAPADLFLSANRQQVERLQGAGRVEAGSTFAFAASSLVVVSRRHQEVRELASARDLLRFERLAIADPQAVPAGVYARRWLEAEGLWDSLAERVVPTLDVRAALAAVAAGNAPAAVVYSTDAEASSRVVVIYRPSSKRAPKVRFWAAIVAPAGRQPHSGVQPFIDQLRGEAGARLLAAHGFEVVH